MNFRKLFNTSDDVQISDDVQPKSVKLKNADPISIVKEIHDSFDNELNNILAEVNIKHDLEKVQDTLAIKSQQLLSLGFTNTPEVLKLQQLTKENDVKIKANKKKEEILEGIRYFQQKYPLYKLITLDSLDKLCEKYQLGYAAINAFRGEVPQKNLDALLQCKIEDDDKALLEKYSYSSAITETTKLRAYLSLEFQTTSSDYIRKSYNPSHIILSPLIIAAPPTDFIRAVQNAKFGKLQPIKNLKDPIVMQPVVYNDHIFALIITAWGLEASDPEVVNQLMN